MTIPEFKIGAQYYIDRYSVDFGVPKFKIGDRVITTPGNGNDYLSTVIFSRQKATVMTFDVIPLIKLDRGGDYYVHQDKLRRFPDW